MKKIIFTILALFSIIFISSAQVNPVQNLNWNQWYEYPNNYFTLEWDEPEQPHDEIIGYNVYQEDELYIFINETSIYNIYNPVNPANGSNCGGESFLFYNNLNGFDVYVTAVYTGQRESSSKMAHVYGPALNTNRIKKKTTTFYPNPTNGILNIKSTNLKKIQLFDITGKILKVYEPKNQIDLSGLEKGIYIIKLYSESGIKMDKIVIK
ncbi:Por secretion system C-terminal sorting domain-containing protein [Mesonia phycicola]|uniref:Por secretion system C-terminal sorting domain-containing protein n=1 Tax=Mesonia phycicola TaxID=579105 RepID=A0A1M6HK32_9FLAO|nr:T9SS type A sorting domain-containing protein [Mesonia phycicola]SHJ22527.1 Por secretion system C-terminal sorting domain-containing protein [Mesonia phycicola]